MIDEQSKNRILEQRIGDAGERTGRRLDEHSDFRFDFFSQAAGARLGAEWAAKRLKSERHDRSIAYMVDIDTACEDVYEILSGMGEIIETSDEPLGIAAVVGSGFLNMNPTIVTATFAPEDEGATAIHLSAVAKEGLIKQKSAEKAITRLIEILSQGRGQDSCNSRFPA